MRSYAILLGGTLACASAAGAGASTGGAPMPVAVATRDTVIPAGYGTLKQDQFTISLRSGPLLLKATPLDESVIRLAAPDTYQKLHALAAARRPEARPGQTSELFLVSLFSYQPDVTYTPEDLQVGHQGRVLRPVQILPITPGWGRQRLQQQESQMAIYVFDQPIDYDQPITLHFGLEQSDTWSRILQALRTERDKIRARAATTQ